MVPKPPLVGLRGAAEVLDHSPEYGTKAATYTPTSSTLASLRGQGEDVQVKVFFGSWCSVCKRYLPYSLKLDQSLEESKVQFQYYGLTNPPEGWTDPEVKKMKVQSLPTAVVFVNGREAGRITGNSWLRPGQALDRIVKNAG
jgi:thiol-disulfide isomerase/thioredoxin